MTAEEKKPTLEEADEFQPDESQDEALAGETDEALDESDQDEFQDEFQPDEPQDEAQAGEPDEAQDEAQAGEPRTNPGRSPG